jgi:hypothetical protein
MQPHFWFAVLGRYGASKVSRRFEGCLHRIAHEIDQHLLYLILDEPGDSSTSLTMRLRVVRTHGGRAGFLVHQIALELHAETLVLSLRCLQLKLGIDGSLFCLRIAHLKQNRVRLHLRTGKHENAHDGRFGFSGNLAHRILAGHERPETTHLPQRGTLVGNDSTNRFGG